MEDDENGWRLFLGNNTEFILPLDYIRDMAVEEPGDSPVLMAKFGNKGRSFGECTFWNTVANLKDQLHGQVLIILSSEDCRARVEGDSKLETPLMQPDILHSYLPF